MLSNEQVFLGTRYVSNPRRYHFSYFCRFLEEGGFYFSFYLTKMCASVKNHDYWWIINENLKLMIVFR